jgi:flagellar biosynthetic protein FliR
VDVTIDTLYAFVLVLMRTAGLAMSLPSWGSRSVPMRIRLGLTLVLSFAVYQGAGAPHFTPPDSIGLLMGQSMSETLIGLIGGLAARWTLEAAAAAGGLISLATGLSYGQLVDPINGAESNALGQILRLLALAFAIEAGLHREAVLWLLESLRASPIGGDISLQDMLVRSMAQAGYSVALAVRIAFPVLAVVGLIYIALGAVGRVVPQLGLQNLGFSVAILGGGSAVYVLAPEAAHRIGQLAVQTLARAS